MELICGERGATSAYFSPPVLIVLELEWRLVLFVVVHGFHFVIGASITGVVAIDELFAIISSRLLACRAMIE